jgi:hypothetical protein
VVVDNVGRLQIPPDLRDKTKLGDRATVSLTEEGHLLIKAVAERAGSVNGRSQETATLDAAPPKRKQAWRLWKK